MKHVVTAQGKLAELRYELPHRAHDAHVYPVKAPNGSTIAIYAHETGVGLLWRGGRPLKSALAQKQPEKPPKVNGTSTDVVMIIDSDDDEPAKAPPVPKAEFADEEEELDPDQPYPSVVQHLRLALNAEVLHIAVPHVPAVSPLRAASTMPTIFRNKIVFAVACADYTIRIVTLPLSPPSHAAKEALHGGRPQYGDEIVKIASHTGHQSIPDGVTLTWTPRAAQNASQQPDAMQVDSQPAADTSRGQSSGTPKDWDLLVASHSKEIGGLLKLWRFALSESSVVAKSPITAYQTLTLQAPATRVVFNSAQYPKERHSQLLIADRSGIVRIYDPFAPPNRRRRTAADVETGQYVALFRAPFEQPPANSNISPALVSRKPLLDAAWTSDGNSIFALLGDGEWGIWDVARTGPSPPKDPSNFSIRGFVGTSSESRSSSSLSPRSRKSSGSLAPMTPNTRKIREERLFQPSSSPVALPRGGINVASLPSSDGVEESVVFWCGSDVYRISNFTQFWTRFVTASALNRPSPSRVQGVNLFGEAITSMDQFGTTSKDARMAIPRDLLVSTDHRLLILTNNKEPIRNDLFAADDSDADEDMQHRTESALLSRGELDLGGMNRLLDLEEGSSGPGAPSLLPNPRRVLFASSAA